jgi:hypothetical protein
MTEIAEKAGTSGQSSEEKRESVPANWEERKAASATTTEAMETGAPAAAAAEIIGKRARDEAEESGEEEAPTRTKVLIRGAEVETETPKKTDEKSGDPRQLQPGQGWRIEAARRRIFAALKKITEATNRELTGKLAFRRDDQRQVREAQEEIQEAVSDMLTEVVLAREERVLQVRLQRMEATAGRDTRGPSQKKLDQLWENLGKEASEKGGTATVGAVGNRRKEEGREEKPGRSDQGVAAPGGPKRGGKAPGGGCQDAPTKGAQPQGLDQWGAVPRGPEDDLRAEAESPRGGSPRDRRRCRLGVRVEECPPTGGHQSDRGSGGPDEHSEGRVCGPCLQDQRTEGEAGAGTAQERGSDGEGHPKEEPHIDPDRAGGALEHRRGGGGRPPKERLAAQRTAAGRVPEKLRVPHQDVVPKREAAEHGLRRGTQNPPRGNGERKGRCRYDALLRDGGDPGEEVFQVPSFRPHSEGVQEQGAVLQVRERGPPEERVHGGGQEVPELRQGQEGVNEPLRDGQEVPRG